MLILVLFSILAGIATVLSPCIIPILPAVLSGGVQRGRLRPIGIIAGLILSFSFFTLSLTAIVKATGISPDVVRYIAIGSIALFGAVMLFPPLSDFFTRLTSVFSSAGNSLQQRTHATTTTGFLGGFLLGITLGLVWTPCAGPILASVTTLAITGNVSAASVIITLAYSLGAGIPLLLIAYGGNKVTTSSRFFAQRAELIRKVFGVLMILTALAMLLGIDRSIQVWSVKYFPTLQPDTGSTVTQALKKLQSLPATQQTTTEASLDNLGKAPELRGIVNWIGSEPLTLASLKGKVVLVDFWTYSCINCIRTIPYIQKWYETYKEKGFVVIGVHAPEFEFEKNKDNVSKAIKRFGITYPVAQDNNFATWTAYQNQYWPASYLIDKDGVLRFTHFGEANGEEGYKEIENKIRALLDEEPLQVGRDDETRIRMTPETYLGYQRARSYTPSTKVQRDLIASYTYTSLDTDEVGLQGAWRIEQDRVTCTESTCMIGLRFRGGKVHLVMSGTSSSPATVMLDGKPLSPEMTSQDMRQAGVIVLDGDREYTLLDLHGIPGEHTLTLTIPKGISAYAFSFGK